jgi:hypothetical protein
MWFEGFPAADTPWQEEQVAVTPLWSMRTEVKVEVEVWQSSHCAEVLMWFEGFPEADTPWQVEHLPAEPPWSMRAPNQLFVEWHSSHWPVVCR